ncbi:threonine ammonia-lyase IlvA [Candidatus Gottesmanbacteria bacterium]|nr:threonine ammonia-lyase IlvA [Candidatus Gottesmanbacteria bacterium]
MKTDLTIESIDEASLRLKGVVKKTPLQYNKRLSNQYKAHVYLKREDLQDVRSYKIRGAYNLMSTLTLDEKKSGVVCASAGNHAQGVALSSSLLKIRSVIFMPSITPLQKINKVKHFGGRFITIKLVGQTYDEASHAAKEFCKKNHMVFVHPFDDLRTIAGQGTVGKEIYDQKTASLDYVLCPVGGGGLISGVSSYLKAKDSKVKIIAVEAEGAPTLFEALKNKKIVDLNKVDTFVDGTAVKTLGKIPFEIAITKVFKSILVAEGKVSTTMIELYQNEGIVTEPAGALSVAALEEIKGEIKGKHVVCIISGGNNDILRYPEIMERSLVYLGLKHYFLIEFAQKPGQLKKFVNKVLGPTDDIVRFEYMKKTSKERGPALIGIELQRKKDLKRLLDKMNKEGIRYTKLESSDPLYSYLI